MDAPVVLVVIAGPQASGKSALAASLAADLRSHGEQVALVELDQIAAMALPTLPDWQVAHRIFETVTGLWAQAPLTCVIAEGSGSRAEVAALLDRAPEGIATLTVATTVPVEVAIERTQADPTRGISRDPDFLRRVYRNWPPELAGIGPDLVLDTGELSLAQSVNQVRTAIGSARDLPRQ